MYVLERQIICGSRFPVAGGLDVEKLKAYASSISFPGDFIWDGLYSDERCGWSYVIFRIEEVI